MDEQQSGIEINVVEQKNGKRHVAIFFHDLNQMLLVSPTNARTMAFMLTECADFVEPPFESDGTPEPENAESVAFFGPYDGEDEELADFDEDIDDLDEDEF